MTRDYYEVLGVPRTASDDEIRRAYRQAAKVSHPDLHGGDVEVEARFKEINEAYEVLRDPQKRAAYDRYGHAAFNGGRGAAGVDPFDVASIFEQFFGGTMGGRPRPGSGPAPEAGADLKTRLRLGFEEAVFGGSRQVEIARRELCDTCSGSGAAAGSRPAQCGACSGTGQVRHVTQSVFGSFVNVQTCRACGGRGEVVEDRCADCDGAGRVRRTRVLDIDLPAGLDDGNQIRLSGEGEHGRFGGPPGDLFVAIEVEPHPAFVRDGNDLHLGLRLNAAEAALGTQVTVPILGGEQAVKIPAGTQSGDTLTLPGQGVPFLKRNGRGDLVLDLVVVTPERLGTEARRLYEALLGVLPAAEVMQRERGFWQRVREKLG